MITEDYVSYEVAKLLKDKGFPQTRILGDFITNMVYKVKTNESGKHSLFLQYPDRIYNKDRYIAAPTYQMAMKWLREVHNLFLAVGFGADAKGEFLYMADIYNLRNDAIDGIYKPIVEADDYLLNNPKSYEEACEAAIKYCLENLI